MVRSTLLVDSLVEILLTQAAPLSLTEIVKLLPDSDSRPMQAVANLLGRLEFIQGGRRHSQRWGGSRGYEFPLARLADSERQRLGRNLETPPSANPLVPVAWGPGFLTMLASLRPGTAVRIDGAGDQRYIAHAVAAGMGIQSVAAS